MEKALKYSILMPCLNRQTQLNNTLASFAWHYGLHDRTDYEVILMEDSKTTDDLSAVVNAWRLAINICHVKQECPGFNPSTLFNAAAKCAAGEYLILTSPECLHFVDVLGMFDEILEAKPEAYVIGSCMSARKVGRFTSPDNFDYKEDRWYQHSVYNNKGLHFCSVLSKSQYTMVGGFDEKYADGIAYEDDAFRDIIKLRGIEVIPVDAAVVLHQEHDKPANTMMTAAEYRRRIKRNRDLYKKGLS